MHKKWRIFSHDSAKVALIERSAGVPPIVAQLLIQRGVTDPAVIRTFLDAKLTGLRDPDLLPGAAEAADLVLRAVRAGKKIVVYGDYDCDGITATAILLGCLKLVGADATYYVPNRLEEGYGLNADALRTIAERGGQLVITVDCGVASVAEAEVARELGLELIITDHHEFGPELPHALIVHPRLPGGNYPFAGLCGAGVAFKLAWAICQRFAESKKVTEPMRNYLMSAVGLAALGTVADVVPLVDENRLIVKHGLLSLKQQPPVGLAALMTAAKLNEKERLASEDIAFTLAPRINAAGRFGQAQLAVELLTTDNPTRAQQLADYINELNRSRDSLERSIQLAASKQVKELYDPEHDSALVLAGSDWHVGVIGLVAGRIAEKHHLPVVILSLDPNGAKPATGSARSPNGLHLHEALGACSEFLLGFGGHAAAAGLRIEPEKIDAFRNAFVEHAATSTPVGGRRGELRIDAEGPFSQLTVQIVNQIDALAPFGCGNPRPVLCATGVTLAEPPKKMGGGEKHLALKLRQHGSVIRCVGFGFGEAADELAQLNQPLDIAYRPMINNFAGRQSVELHLVDWRPSTIATTAPQPA